MITKVNTEISKFDLNGVIIAAKPIRLTKRFKLVYYTEKGIKEIIEEKCFPEPKNLSEEKKLIRSGHIAMAASKELRSI